MTYKYDALVFIGRFQPFHLGHEAVIRKALSLSKHVIVLVGSANRGRSLRNPFTYEERVEMIRANFTESENVMRIETRPLPDIMYNDTAWIKQTYGIVNRAVLEVVNQNQNFYPRGLDDLKVGLIGCQKDATSYYLNLFPKFKSENVDPVDPTEMLSSTDIREVLFGHDVWQELKGISRETRMFLKDHTRQEWFDDLRNEYKWHQKYKENVHQFPRIEHTVDSVVIQAGYVLLIRRRDNPGKGLWALPGGFLNPSERLVDGAIRELREETGLKVPEKVLRGSIKAEHTYDDPNRSERGRLITNAYLFHLDPGHDLPHVKGMDDADKAKWVPLSDLKPDLLFEDHFFILEDMIRRGGV